MDAPRLDALARSLATVPRRRVLAVLAGGLLATLPGRRAAARQSCVRACADQPRPRRAACKRACRQCRNRLDNVCFGTDIFCCAGSPDPVCCVGFGAGDQEFCAGAQRCDPPKVAEGCLCVCPPADCPAGEAQDLDTCACVPGTCSRSGRVCGDLAFGPSCGGGGPCDCLVSAEGPFVCADIFGLCQHPTCTSSAECAAGEVCVLSCGECSPVPPTGRCARPCA